MTRACIGDSIALGAGEALKCTTDARVGAPSSEVLRRARASAPGRDEVVFSVGSNNPTDPKLVSDVAAIRACADIGARVVWLLPQHPTAARIVKAAAGAHGDRTVSFQAGADGVHPKSYAVVAAGVESAFAAAAPVPAGPAPVAPPAKPPAASSFAPNRAAFFAVVRGQVCGGRITAPQVAGIEAVLAEAPTGMALAALAYCLATAFWETGRTMQPIAEYGHGAGHTYGAPDPVTGQTYYGRGYVQLTWKANYAKAGTALGLDLVGKPELALEPDVAARILFDGMTAGWFTGRKLADYFGSTKSNPVGARAIVNGSDHAADIAGLYAGFLAALRDGAVAALTPPTPAPPMAKPEVVKVVDPPAKPAAPSVLVAPPLPTPGILARVWLGFGRWVDRVWA